MSFMAVVLVILFITTSLTATLLVAICVALVDLFLLALLYYWGLTFNTIVVLQIVIALGLAVDYSAHIAHCYLVVIPPKGLCKNNAEKRLYKVKKALSQIGSSIFHGGFSTFLAIITLSPSKSYVFIVFFRAWFGIIIFGMANGFILLPVMLSFVGPTEDVGHVEEEKDKVLKAFSKNLPGLTTRPLAIKESAKAEEDGNDTSRDKEDVKNSVLEKEAN